MTSTVQIEFVDPSSREKARPGGNWHPGDFDFWDSKKAMDKVRRNLDSLSYDFNLTVLVGQMPKVRQLVPEQPVYDDKINVVYCNNVTSLQNWIPMTSWILLHRIAHSLSVSQLVFNDDYPVFNGPEYRLFQGLHELWQMVYQPGHIMQTRPSIGWNALSSTQDFPSAGFLANYLFTMRSARERAISNELDIFAEAFAQFLHTGRFRLNRWEEAGIEALGHTNEVRQHPRSQMDWAYRLRQDLTHRLTSVEVINEKISQIEEDANKRMAELARRMVGLQFAF